MGSTGHSANLMRLLLASTAAAVLAGCSDSLPSLPKMSDLNPFLKTEPPLPGKRVAIMDVATGSTSNLAPADRPITLPPPQANEGWPQPGGTAGNTPGHVALAAAIKQVWSADAGSGSSSTGKVTASPIVYDGRVYTLDAAGRVSSFAVSGGSAVWRTTLVPDKEKASGGFFSLGSSSTGGGYGGGLAADAGRIYAASGYGVVVALDAKSGKKLWEKDVGAPVRASPTATADRVFLVTTEGKLLALAGSDGSELWSARGLPEQASLIGSPSPAAEADVVVAPFASGELMAVRMSSGQTIWSESLNRTRGSSAMAAMSDAARPALDGGLVFAIGHGGRMIATQARTGERVWSINLSGTQGPAVAGENVFVVDSSGQLLALSRRTGQTLWTIKLPDSNVWSGPTLAGGNLWLVSNKGLLTSVDAATGRIVGQLNLGSPVFIAPIVAQGRMFVLTDNARLIALQ